MAIGDTYGAPHEGGPLERLLWKMIGKTAEGKMRYTDDTQMSIDLATSFLHNNGTIDQDHLAVTFANSYRWSRGYGAGAAWLLKKIRSGGNWRDLNHAKFKEGSYGNGAAMRAPLLAMLFSEDREKLHESIITCSEITHAHPLAIEGAKLIALTTDAALHDQSNAAILEALPTWCHSNEYQTKVDFCVKAIRTSDRVPNKELKEKLGNSIAASQSVVTAIYFALIFRDMECDAMLTRIYSLGGDTDTIGAMAGAIWGACNGRGVIEQSTIQRIENAELIQELAGKLYALSY